MATWAGPRRVTHKPPRPASVRGLAAAMEALASPATGQGSEALLAERERLAHEASAAQVRQGALRLRARS